MDARLHSLEQLLALPIAGELLVQKSRFLVTISPGASLVTASQLMAENDIGFLPVIEGANLVGVLSERDIVRRVSLGRSTAVGEIMTTDLHTVGAETNIHECLAIMHRARIRHLPVVDGRVLHGVLSVRDLMGALVDRQELLLRRLKEERVMILSPYSSSY